MFKKIKKCRICFNKDLVNFFDLGNHQPSNSLKNKISDFIPSVPLGLTYCKNCKVVQLSATADPKFLFEEYVWVTGTSDGAKKYSNIFYKNIVERYNKRNLFVCEIASNDGTFLQKFKSRGHKVLGVDPAKNISKIANKNGIPTIAKFFDENVSNQIMKKHGKADVIFARNVIPHVEQIHSIAKGIDNLIKQDGLVAIEFHYSKKILEELHYDSIYHEHLFYFSIKTITNFFKKYGLYSYDVSLSPISGGSLVIYFSKRKNKKTNFYKKKINQEKNIKLNNFFKWNNFSKDSLIHSKNLLKLIKKTRKSEKIFGYGASARSSTLLNFSNINSKHLDFIIDKNMLKNKKLTPGTNIKILHPKNIKKKVITEYKYCLLLAWNFKDEIIKDLKKLKFKGKVIVPLPRRIKIYEI